MSEESVRRKKTAVRAAEQRGDVADSMDVRQRLAPRWTERPPTHEGNWPYFDGSKVRIVSVYDYEYGDEPELYARDGYGGGEPVASMSGRGRLWHDHPLCIAAPDEQVDSPWSTERPTEEGYYWFRCDAETHERVVEVYRARDTGEWFVAEIGTGIEMLLNDVSYDGAEWCKAVGP